MKYAVLYLLSLGVFVGCTNTKKAIKSLERNTVKAQNTFESIAQATIFSDSNFAAAHVGISIYNPETQQYLYNYQGDKYFVPASNMKLFTCYAAMKNLGDSLVGVKYSIDKYGGLELLPTADPTFLHQDFKNQPVYNYIKNFKSIYILGDTVNKIWQSKSFGKGWAWDDYNSSYAQERSMFPIYNNLVSVSLKDDSLRISYDGKVAINHNFVVSPQYFNNKFLFNAFANRNRKFALRRQQDSNSIILDENSSNFIKQEMPFITSASFSMTLLKDTIENYLFRRDSLLEIARKKKANSENRDYIGSLKSKKEEISSYSFKVITKVLGLQLKQGDKYSIIHSQPTDSLLKPMMHNSDNFFAEQTLLMVSNEKLGVMNDEKIIDTLLKTDFKGLPQKPRWIDGSGLSRYNLITPQDFVWVLNKMKADFSWQRITTILPTGNQGTLSNYYKNLAGNIFAKTGTLSGQVALSGYLVTKQGKTLVFSVLVNNHQTSATAIRRGVEKFLTQIYEQY